MDEARYLRRGALIFIPFAIFVVLLASVKAGSGNMIPGVPGNAFSGLLLAALCFHLIFVNRKW